MQLFDFSLGEKKPMNSKDLCFNLVMQFKVM